MDEKNPATVGGVKGPGVTVYPLGSSVVVKRRFQVIG